MSEVTLVSYALILDRKSNVISERKSVSTAELKKIMDKYTPDHEFTPILLSALMTAKFAFDNLEDDVKRILT